MAQPAEAGLVSGCNGPEGKVTISVSLGAEGTIEGEALVLEWPLTH